MARAWAQAQAKATNSPANSPTAAPGFSLPSLGGMPAVGGAAIGLGAPAVAPGTGGGTSGEGSRGATGGGHVRLKELLLDEAPLEGYASLGELRAPAGREEEGVAKACWGARVAAEAERAACPLAGTVAAAEATAAAIDAL